MNHQHHDIIIAIVEANTSTIQYKGINIQSQASVKITKYQTQSYIKKITAISQNIFSS